MLLAAGAMRFVFAFMILGATASASTLPTMGEPRLPITVVSAPSAAQVLGQLSADDVQDQLLSAHGALHACYRAALSVRPGLMGELSISLAVTGHGVVSQVSVPRSSVDDAELESCVTEAFVRVRFHAPTDGAPAKVLVPLRLTRG